MNVRYLAVACCILLTISIGAGAQITKRLVTDPPLPAELTSDVDSFAFAKVSTMRNPLTFAPYKVTALKNGWTRTDTRRVSARVSTGSIAGADVRARQKFSFTLNDGSAASWSCKCGWASAKEALTYEGKRTEAEVPLNTGATLECDFSDAAGAKQWTLQWDVEASASGAGMQFEGEGLLSGSEGAFSVVPLFLFEDSKVVGDIPAGYIFRSGGRPVAAVQARAAGSPSRFTVKRDVEAPKRSILAAATSALMLYERVSTELDLDEF
jgi:hypothetical protein